MSVQSVVNYTDDAQRRVAADTLCIQRKTELVVTSTGQVTLPDDLVRIEGMYVGASAVQHASEQDLLAFLSAGSVPLAAAATYACIISRTLYLLPVPTEDITLTLIYKARSAAFSSTSQMEVTGPFETLTDLLVTYTMQIDSGQVELAMSGTTAYRIEAQKLYRRATAKPGNSGRVRTVRRL